MEQEVHLTESVRTLIQPGNEIWPTYAILQKNDFYQKLFKKYGLETSLRTLCKKMSGKVYMLILIYFDNFAHYT